MYTFLFFKIKKTPKRYLEKQYMGKKTLRKKTTKIPQTKSKPLLASVMMNKFKQSVSLYLLHGEKARNSLLRAVNAEVLGNGYKFSHVQSVSLQKQVINQRKQLLNQK